MKKKNPQKNLIISWIVIGAGIFFATIGAVTAQDYKLNLWLWIGFLTIIAGIVYHLVLQGVVDCAIVEPGGITVLDFKTDRVTAETAPRRAESYRPQLEAYTHALERVLEKEVSEKLLYFFRCDTCLSL